MMEYQWQKMSLHELVDIDGKPKQIVPSRNCWTLYNWRLLEGEPASTYVIIRWTREKRT